MFYQIQTLMKRYLIILFAACLLAGCSKEDNISVVTLDNNIKFNKEFQTYFVYGFLFSQAKKVSTLDTPPPDITLDDNGTQNNIMLQTNNNLNSFYKAGEYKDAASAQQEFDKLTSFTAPPWVVWADSLKANQIWLFRTNNETYAKIRIVDTKFGNDYSECTFEWAYQPDGTLTFPGK